MSSDKPKISILTTIKDKNDFLSNTLLSIKNQITSYDYNLCIIDDGSKTAWTAKERFGEVIRMCHNTKKLRGEPKDPRYLFLAGMQKEDFIQMAGANDYQCDEWTRKTLFEDMKLPLYVMKEQVAIHQCHPHVLFDCKNAERCPNEWCNRKTFKKLGIELPFNQGYYDPDKDTFEIPLPRDTSSL